MILSLVEWLLLYPASGFRSPTSGTFGLMGSYGLYWHCASTTGANVYYLEFSETVVTPIGGFQRGRGYGVRCVQYLLLFVYSFI